MGTLLKSWVFNKQQLSIPAIIPELGLLYNWYAVDDSRGIVPIGWHIPTEAEFDTLALFLGGESIAGGKMKEIGLTHWDSPNTGADNSSGFTGLGGGLRIADGSFGSFKQVAYFFGSDTVMPTLEPSALWLSSNNVDGSIGAMPFKAGLSIRCLRDTVVGWVAGEQVIDYDGNVYDTVQIGTQIWLVQNLAVIHYNNGDVIPEVTGNTAWAGLTTGALCAYNNDWTNVFE